MEKRLLALVMLVVCVVSLTSCSTVGKYVNTNTNIEDSYIQVSVGSDENSGHGYARNMYCTSESDWLTGDFRYTSGNVAIRQLGRWHDLDTSGFSIDAVNNQISYSGYTYKKK